MSRRRRLVLLAVLAAIGGAVAFVGRQGARGIGTRPGTHPSDRSGARTEDSAWASLRPRPSPAELAVAPRPAVGDAAAAPAAAPSPAGARDTRPFLGRVVDESGRGIVGATVRLGSRDVPSFGYLVGTTVEGGAFRIDAPGAAARLDAIVAADGYAPRGMEHLGRGVAQDLVVVRGAELRIRVVDAKDRAPVPGALLRVLVGDATDGEWEYRLAATPAAIATSGPDGRAVVRVATGPAQVVAIPRGHAPAVSDVVSVGPDGGAVELAVPRGFRVVGRVDGSDGSPLAGATVTVNVRGWLRRETSTAPDGTYELGNLPDPPPDEDVVPGAWVQATAPGHAIRRERLPPPPLDGETCPVSFRLSTARSVAGHVVGPDGRPVPGVRGSLELVVRMRTQPEEDLDETIHSEVAIEADGSFRLMDVDSGRARLVIRDPQGGRFGSFAVPDEDRLFEIRLLARELAPVEVRVVEVDGRPAPNVDVWFGTPAAGGHELGWARTSADGVATLRVVALGPVLAIARVARSPGARARLRAGDGGAWSATIVLPRGVVEGVVFHADGSPATDGEAVIDSHPLVGAGVYASTSLDAGGRFRFERVPEGELRLRVRSTRGGCGEVERNVRAGDPPIVVRLAPVGDAPEHVPTLRIVEDPASGRDARTRITLHLRPASPGGAREVELRGRFVEPDLVVGERPLPAGTWRCELRVTGRAPVVVGSLVLPRTGAPPEVRLRPGIELEGRFADEEGRPFLPAHVTANGSSTWTSHDGTWSIGDLPPGPIEVELFSEATGSVRAVANLPESGKGLIDVRAPRRGSIAVDFDRSPSISLELRVVAVATGAETVAGRRARQEVWVAPGLAAGRYRIRGVYDGIPLPDREVTVEDGTETAVELPAP